MEEPEALRVVASADRQIVLQELSEANSTISVKELSRKVASRRNRTPPSSISDKRVRYAQIRLVHRHLPLLEDRDVIDAAWRDGEVKFTDEESVEQLFQVADDLQNWPPDDLLEEPTS